MGRIGLVFFDDSFAGTIKEDEGFYSFIYDPAYRGSGTPVGYNFPLTGKVFISKNLFPLFDNLISEGWLLDLQASTKHLDPEDRFGLLLRNGMDLSGSITVREG
jgi:serine/threonine-protein kinase HipA